MSSSDYCRIAALCALSGLRERSTPGPISVSVIGQHKAIDYRPDRHTATYHNQSARFSYTGCQSSAWSL
ncbi:hypothetical protein DM734_19275 [Salmonella enterica subsp. enterica serovar Enteritidis]|nr:hypothetical protein [Salmonella enterica subsp. enterica serovar Enteritidis]EBY6609099.1 hypothetical protein [Salmonella enterica subsp. enterica serovar Enteritidis]EBZ8982487.1 hypothetical protein [Salmonella enterica subsp. enterica serovar Enteritidis]EBZ9865712.1 hypothetical protein [Salmonella enterica subsp. enterica serovar Enteritidis]